MRISTATAVAGAVALVAGAVAVAPGAPAAVPVPPDRGGDIVQIDETQTQPLGTAGESYLAITQPGANGAYAIRAADRRLERINDTGVATYAIPEALADEPIRSLDANSSRVVVVTDDDGLPHLWGATASMVTAAKTAMASTTLLGAPGAPAEATQVAVATTNLVGVLLADGRVGVFSWMAGGVYLYRVLDTATLPEKVVQIEGFGGSAPGLFLRLENGGALIWKASTDPALPQGTVVVPAFPEMAGRPSGPEDKLVDIQAENAPSSTEAAVGVTAAGKVYAVSTGDGSRIPESLLPATGDRAGKAVEAAVIDDPGGTYLVRTDQNKLYLYGENGAGQLAALQAQVDALDLTGKEVVSVTGATSFQLILADEVIPPLAEQTRPAIAGTPQAGSTLTGTPATFNDAEADRTSEWLAGTDVVGTGTELLLTAEHVGKTITFRTTATRGDGEGDNRAVSVSDPTAPVTAAPIPGPGGPSAACTATQAAASAAQAALGTAQAKAAKAKAKLKKAKKAKKPAKKIAKLKKKVKKAKQAQKSAAAASVAATAAATAACK